MKNKIIVLGEEAREKLICGIDKLANAVKITLGPEGKTVILASYSTNEVKITKDGVSVANEVFLTDKIENAAAQIVKEVASKTALDAGDGTTTATVLAQALIHECVNKNESSFFTELLKEKDIVIENLKSQAVTITIDDIKTMTDIASISANNNREIGELVADAYYQTGKYGIVSAEEGDNVKTEIKLTKGMNFDSGFMSPAFITDKEKLICEMSDVMIFMYDDILTRVSDILPHLRIAAANKKMLLVIASDISGEALNAMIANKSMCVAVKTPSFGDYRKSLMIDIATVTGGPYIEAKKGYDFTDFTDAHYGYAEKVIITKDETTIIEGKGKDEKISSRITQLENQIAATGNEYENKLMKQRIAKMKGGVAIIKVGGHSQIEIKEKKDRIEDAVFAVKAALEEGIVAGGGVAYLKAREAISLPELKNALAAPFRQIAKNADIPKIDSLQNEISNGYVKGFNAKTKRTADMFEEGIIDPVKVTRVALENAVSIATTFLTTECIIVEE